MIKFLTRFKSTFITLSWIGILVDNNLISPTQGRLLEGAIYTFYIGLLTFVYNNLGTNDWSNWKLTLYALGISFGKTAIECLLKYFRNSDTK